MAEYKLTVAALRYIKLFIYLLILAYTFAVRLFVIDHCLLYFRCFSEFHFFQIHFIQVSAGGVNVHGGISILSGGLSLPEQPFSVGSLQATSSATNLHDSVISGTTTSPHYVGSMLELTSSSTDSDTSKMMSYINLLHSTTNSDETTNTAISVFQVKGSGQISSSAGALFKGPQGIDVYGSMLMRGKVALQRTTLSASDNNDKNSLQVIVPLNATYVVITRTDTTTTNDVNSINVVFEPSLSSHSAGRVLLISNNDSIVTSGSVQIPPYTTVLLVYDGENWVSVDALKAPMHVSIPTVNAFFSSFF